MDKMDAITMLQQIAEAKGITIIELIQEWTQPKKSEQIHIRLTLEEKHMLSRIAEAKNSNSSKIIRTWIRAMYKKLFPED